jgi:ribosomal subunit interface protein
MSIPLRLTFHGMDPSDAVEQRVREKLDQLERFSDKLMGCRVVVDRPHQHHHQGSLYSVKVELELAGADPILAGRDKHDDHAHEDVYVALRDAFEAAKRQLEKWVDRSRKRTKSHEVAPHGEVIRLSIDQEYGFLRASDGLEIYFHRNSIVDGEFEQLEVGTPVRFVVAEGEGEMGPQASSVTPIGKHHLVDAESVPS